MTNLEALKIKYYEDELRKEKRNYAEHTKGMPALLLTTYQNDIIIKQNDMIIQLLKIVVSKKEKK